MVVTTYSTRERRLWVLAGVLTLAIYASLPVVRLVADWLRERGQLRVAVLALFGLTAAAIVIWRWCSRPGWRETMVLLLAAGIYVVILSRLSIPEERVHFLEYGALAGLVYAALEERQRARACSAGAAVGSPLWVALLAVLLTSAAGWVDELIQRLLPTRVYDLRDVAMNAMAALLMVAILASARRARVADRQPEAPAERG